ncbi:uncharacterized protein LOC124547424 [Schistocerca americana]|uniref:uncharacterized protein LOC124547424 n=1 Tax=Schistocerca americana TaxID=7009 RepID=UPI001F500BFA|nr:uncharacterized protein LOC124547424 [Schistocerca americana]
MRMRGQAYIVYRRSRIGKITHDTPRGARKLGPTCTSKMCQKSVQRKCHQFSIDDRQAVFNTFWETMSWGQRKVYVTNLVDTIPTKRPGKNTGESRRKGPLIYHLINEMGKHKVCNKIFLNSLGIKEWTVRYRMGNSTHGMSPDTESSRPRIKQTKKEDERTFMKEFLESLPKLPSHYCRKSSSKLYLKPVLQSKKLCRLYMEKCHAEKVSPLSLATLHLILEDGDISLFSPKRDQCDLCYSCRLGKLCEDMWKQHTERKEQARMQKDTDKKNPQQKLCSVYTMDLQAVKVAPFLSASAVYYKTKLAVYNCTMYNLQSRDAVCYWFDETQGDLVASCFASCIVDTLSRTIK